MAGNNDDIDANDDTDQSTSLVTTELNQQIVQAVGMTNSVVLGAAGPEAAGIAYQKVAQAAAFSVQDATDYLRNIMTIAGTAQGVCLQLMIENPALAAEYVPIITAATGAVTSAQTNFTEVGAAAGTIVSNFPSS
ncbi:hypothetical protein [Kordiimonas sp.]|uniref:hypothetical protein n=1 Tax=Kordiimonas sp. TaxID=1970157 RepID=UPI003A8E7000